MSNFTQVKFANIMHPEIRKLIRDVDQLASLPSIYERLNEVVNHPRSSAHDIGKVVSEDPGLTARLLRLVNSAFYGFPSKIETVSRAITIIGTNQLRDLSLATSVVGMFKNLPQDLVDMSSFWRHSLACGVTARVLATQRRELNVERYFVAGLLHDIGSLIIYLKAGDKATEVLNKCRSQNTILYLTEEEILGYNHAQVGAALTEQWNLPPSLQEAIGFHHHPATAEKYPTEASMVHVANIIANALAFGSSGEKFVTPLDTTAWETLNLNPDSLPNVISEVEKQFEDVVKVILKE